MNGDGLATDALIVWPQVHVHVQVHLTVAVAAVLRVHHLSSISAAYVICANTHTHTAAPQVTHYTSHENVSPYNNETKFIYNNNSCAYTIDERLVWLFNTYLESLSMRIDVVKSVCGNSRLRLVRRATLCDKPFSHRTLVRSFRYQPIKRTNGHQIDPPSVCAFGFYVVCVFFFVFVVLFLQFFGRCFHLITFVWIARAICGVCVRRDYHYYY